MSWFINTIVVSALIIMIVHCIYEYFIDGEQIVDLADLKTRQYKAIIEKMTNDAKVTENMDTELTEYMKSKIEEI